VQHLCTQQLQCGTHACVRVTETRRTPCVADLSAVISTGAVLFAAWTYWQRVLLLWLTALNWAAHWDPRIRVTSAHLVGGAAWPVTASVPSFQRCRPVEHGDWLRRLDPLFRAPAEALAILH
jgi:hypothetical protein